MRRGRYPWERWSDEELLGLRLSDLGLSIRGSWLEGPIEKLGEELRSKGLRVRPHTWLSEEWFCPDGVPGIAIPFYLAHPRLQRLERRQMMEVEGATRRECLKLLRHEAGHVVQQAYQLHRRKLWQDQFGRDGEPYPDFYRPQPKSRKYVHHLGYFYAQAHPKEDFAETFAVWLTPRSSWRKRYQGWPALEKLQYVDELMGQLAGAKPRLRSREHTDSISKLRKTLGEYYEGKRAHYGVGFSDAYDEDLLRIFSDAPRYRNRETAAAFLRRHRPEIRERVRRWVGENPYAVDYVLEEMIGRCRQLRLRAVGRENRLKEEFALLLTSRSMRCLYRGGIWHAM